MVKEEDKGRGYDAPFEKTGGFPIFISIVMPLRRVYGLKVFLKIR
jgi:hypothetical protein